MAKRGQPSLPPEQPTSKRIHSDQYQKTVADMHRMIQAIVTSLGLTSEPNDEVLADVLVNIIRKAPSETCIKKDIGIETVDDLIKRHPDLKKALNRAIRDGEYEEVLSMPFLKRDDVPHTGSDVPKRTAVDEQNIKATFKAFATPYVASFPQAYLKTVDKCSRQESYNNAMSIVQSSGTGKSRGVIEAAKHRFTFLFNIRRKLEGSHYTYPPPDDSIRDYLVSRDGEPGNRYAAFLCSLFTLAPKYMYESGVRLRRVPLAQWWYDFLNAGENELRPGARRAEFYNKVVEGAKSMLSDGDIVARMLDSCNKFVRALQEEYTRDGSLPGTACLLVFDEAQELTTSGNELTRLGSVSEERTQFHHLGSVLKEINRQVFSVFLSTNSNLRDLAPPNEVHPSLRVQSNPKPLHPPFTELPFDVFAINLNDTLSEQGRATLRDICTIDVMSRFGRALWYTLHENGYTESSIISLAETKLNPTQHFADDELAQFACLAIRIGLDFDASREIGIKAEMKAVASHMRVVFAVPSHREFMRSGTPSEPILAEAAAKLLNGVSGVPLGALAPKVLSKAFERGFLARGERGKMLARLLWTVAHDQAAQDSPKTYGPITFHRPIRVMDFLHCLFPEEYWNTIDNATPIGDDNGLPLSEAFKDAYVCFSHFMDAVAHPVDLHMAYQLLLRGAALSCQRNQRSIDFLAPIHFGSPDSTMLSSSTTSVLQAQVKNQNDPETDVQVDCTLVQTTLPVLSFVHELGSSEAFVAPAPSYLTSQRLHSHHYKFVTHGCSSQTFAVIPKTMNNLYPMLLGSERLMEDFPRSDIEECASLFRQLNPCCWTEKTKPDQRGQVWSWFGKHVG